MAFNLSDVKFNKSKNSLKDEIRICYGHINNMDILTPNVKKAIRKYLDSNIKYQWATALKWCSLEPMIKDLLEYTCNKEYIHIGIEDVSNNEKQIIYEILKATKSGSIKSLIKPVTDDIHVLLSKEEEQTASVDDIMKMFEDLMI